MVAINIIFSVALGLVVTFVIASIMQQFASEENPSFEVAGDGAVARKKFAGFDQVGDGWRWAFSVGTITGLINFFTPVVAESPSPGIGVAFLIIMVAFYVGMMVWWAKEGGDGKALVRFVILGLLFYWPTVSVAGGFVIPSILVVVAFGFMVANLFYFRYKEMDDTDWERKRDLALTIVVSVIAGLLAFGLLANVAWSQIPSAHQTAFGADETTTDQNSDPWYKFYNSDLQNDGDASNDYNFGPNPYVDGKDAKYYDADFRERLKQDPALAAASTAWLDANVGTRYLGEFYESCQGDWAKTMNAAKDGFMNNGQDAYTKNLDAFFKYLDSATKVEIRECKSVSDQMYMNPHTAGGVVPDIIVLLTDDHSGHELVYTFEIKGNTFEVAYRIECGYQPTDVAEIMGITAQDKSTVTSSGPDNPSPSPNPPGPTPDPGPKKDPSKLTPINTEPNDNRGPGENTIGDDPNHSTKDRADNSTSFPSYDAYREYMDYLAEVNQTQRVGGDSNQPSTETPTGTTVDNNAANGTGYGGIDTPTPVSAPAETASGGAITNNSSNAATAWGDGSDPI
ncbi:MAG: hypothetical protein K6G49_02660 [Candidatus Saccharibacteria bacterium]|nr:hypothetical protein [Candidatus Saccharibacteria bacterium]